MLDQHDAAEIFADERLARVRRPSLVQDNGQPARLRATDPAVHRSTAADAEDDALHPQRRRFEQELAGAKGCRPHRIGYNPSVRSL